MNNDLTVGNPSRVLQKFCLPLFGSVIFQQLYNVADSFVSGKFVNENALAAVGNSYEITLIFLAFAFGCNIGCSVIISNLFGAKSYDKMKTAVYTTLISCGVLCLILMLAGFFGATTLLQLIHTPSNIFDDSKLYLDIYILGLPFVFFYNVATGVFSALGDSKTPFIFLACSSTANIAVDILFVTAFNMGVAGVAWATFICQGISCILAILFVIKRLANIKTPHKPKKFSLNMLGKISIFAIPSIFQQSFISVGNIIIQGVINSFGPGVIAGYSAAVKLNNLVITSLTTIGNGISNYSAQNIGAKKLSRVHEGFKSGLKLVCYLCIPLAILYFFAGKQLTGIFIDNPTTEALKTGKEFLKIVSPFYFIIAAKLISDGVLKGAGLMGRFMIATFVDFALRVILAVLLSSSLGTVGIWLAWPISWSTATFLSILFYHTWTKKNYDFHK